MHQTRAETVRCVALILRPCAEQTAPGSIFPDGPSPYLIGQSATIALGLKLTPARYLRVKDFTEEKLKTTAILCSAAFMSLAMGTSPVFAGERVTKAEVSTTTTHRNGAMTTSRSTTQKVENSNGRWTTDRDTGLDRAQERMSAQGLAHSQAMKDHLNNDSHSTTTTTTETRTRR